MKRQSGTDAIKAIQEEYHPEGNDSHPSIIANDRVGRMIPDFVIEAMRTHQTEVVEALE